MKFIIKVIRLWWLFDVFSVAIIDHMNMCSVSQILCFANCKLSPYILRFQNFGDPPLLDKQFNHCPRVSC